jgi:hypothetical protein
VTLALATGGSPGGGIPASPQTIQKDGATVSPMAILDFEGGPLVVNDGLGKVSIYIPAGYLNVTDPRIGVVMNQGADQGAKLQAALDLASSDQRYSAVFVPPGYVVCRQQLEWPTNRQIRLVGCGGVDRHLTSVSAIYWDTDLGAGKYGIDVNLTVFPFSIEDICLEGPGITPVAGQLPCLMDAVKTNTQGKMIRVRATAWRAACYVQNDHQEWRSCDFRGCAHAMDFGENGSGGLGDLVIDRCFLTDQSRSSFAVSSTNTLANLVATQGHAGAAPFGVWRYPSPGKAATGSNASATLTGVAMDWTVPQDGATIEGTNIPPGTTLLSHSGTFGNYSFTLSNTPTGPVTSIVIARRGTVLKGVEWINWSWEGCHHAVFYDDYGVQSGNWGSFSNQHFTTADSSTFAFQVWQQANVAATGANTSTTISGVAVTNFTPTKGMQVIGTNVGAGAVIQTVSGSSGNWTLVVDVANTGAVTQVTVRQPTNLAVYECGSVTNWDFTNGTPCPGYPNHPAIRANTISYVHFADASGIRNNIIDNPTIVRPFVIRGAYNSGGQECEGLTFGSGAQGGGIELAAQICDEATGLAAGELVEYSNVQHIRKCTAGRRAWGHIVGSWSQGEVAVFVTSTMSNSGTKVKNTSGVAINNGELLKPHASGGVQKATSMADAPVIGQAAETFANGALGQCYAHY